MDYNALAAAAMEFLKPCLLAQGGRLVEDGLSAARKKLFDWLKSKFTSRAQSGALEDAAQSPHDDKVMESLQILEPVLNFL